MAILQDLIVSVRNLRAELKVEPKVKVPIEMFAHEPEIRTMIEQNRGAVERLAQCGEDQVRRKLAGQTMPARVARRGLMCMLFMNERSTSPPSASAEKRTGEDREGSWPTDQRQLSERTVSGKGSGESGGRHSQAARQELIVLQREETLKQR